MINKTTVLIFIFSVMLLIGCSSDDSAVSNVTTDNAEKSSVFIESDQYFLKRLDVYVDGLLSESYEYNVDGESRTISRSQSNLEGNPVDVIYSYDEKGGLSKVDYFNQNEPVRTETMQRTSEGRLSGFSAQLLQGEENVTFHYLDDRLVGRDIVNATDSQSSVFSYNTDGTLATLVDAQAESGLSNTTTYAYNAQMQRTATQWDVGSDGSVDESTSIEYDENGNILAIDFFRGTGELYQRDEFIYESSVQPIPNIMKFQNYYLP